MRCNNNNKKNNRFSHIYKKIKQILEKGAICLTWTLYSAGFLERRRCMYV